MLVGDPVLPRHDTGPPSNEHLAHSPHGSLPPVTVQLDRVLRPTADDDLGHLLYGVFTNTEEMFKYFPDAMTLTGNYAYINHDESGLRLGLQVGPDLLIPTDDGGDTEFLMHYGLTAGYSGERFAALTELMGLMYVTEDFDEFSDRFAHSIDFGVSYVSPHFMPGVFYKIWLKEDLSDVVDGVFGVVLDFTM